MKFDDVTTQETKKNLGSNTHTQEEKKEKRVEVRHERHAEKKRHNKTNMSSISADVSSMNFQPGSWQEALYDSYVGARTGANHTIFFAKKYFWQYFLRPLMKGFGMRIREPQRKNGPNEPSTLKVIGIGYGRTGTVSKSNVALYGFGCPL